MIDNKIDTRTADEHSFLTHTFYTKKIGCFLSAFTTINNDVYTEMVLSSKHFAYDSSLHDRNMQSLAGVLSMFGIEPNPDFVFKGKPIENERYLIYRYIKSIFQIPNPNLYLFANDNEYKKFCEINGLEYTQQEWFKRLYIKGNDEEAMEYLLQNSLTFQELYFPSNNNGGDFRATLHDVNRLHDKYSYKSDFMQIFSILKAKKINKLYHFTDKKNIESIKTNGILSAQELLNRGIISKYSSSIESREIDKQMGLSDYVRLSFVKRHPMMFTSMTAYELNPVVIEINPLIALMPDVFFSDRNTLRRGANIGPNSCDLAKIDFDVVNSNIAYYNMNNIESKIKYQAEVLIKKRIGPEFIMNLHDL